MPSPAFLWRDEHGYRSQSGGRGCEDLKRANAGVLHGFLILTRKIMCFLQKLSFNCVWEG